ncbi:hypothetical protein V4U64_003536, partial [Vibrio vulnificus]
MITTYTICGLVVLVAVMATYMLTNRKNRGTEAVSPSSLADQINALLSEKIELEQSTARLKVQSSELEQSNSVLQTQITENETKFNTLLNEKKTIVQELEQSFLVNEKLEFTQASLYDQINELERQVLELNDKIKEKEEIIQNLEKMITA